MFYIYILQSSIGKYYIGCTNNLTRRIEEHNKGFSKFTRNKGVWVLKYKEEFDELSTARKREMQIKSWKKRIAIERLIQKGAFV